MCAAPGAASPSSVSRREDRPGSSCHPAHAPPSLLLPAGDAAHTRANSNLRVAALQQGAFSPGPGTRERGAQQEGRTDLEREEGGGRAGRLSARALRAKWRRVGEGESSSPSTPSSLHPLDGSSGRPDAWLRLSRGWGLESLWGAKLVFSIWRERLVPSGRTDGVKGRRAAGAGMTAKRGEGGTWKNLRETPRNL